MKDYDGPRLCKKCLEYFSPISDMDELCPDCEMEDDGYEDDQLPYMC